MKTRKPESVRATINQAVAENNVETKQSKLDVNYRIAEDDRCGGCEYFIAPKNTDNPDAEGRCRKVLGYIHSEFVCDLYEAAENGDVDDDR